jgi:hypothetical protein
VRHIKIRCYYLLASVHLILRRAQRASKDAGHGAPLRRIRRPHAPADLHAVVAFDHRDLILALQIEPELRPVAGPPPRFRGAG